MEQTFTEQIHRDEPPKGVIASSGHTLGYGELEVRLNAGWVGAVTVVH